MTDSVRPLFTGQKENEKRGDMLPTTNTKVDNQTGCCLALHHQANTQSGCRLAVHYHYEEPQCNPNEMLFSD